jgi:hypothetical protein
MMRVTLAGSDVPDSLAAVSLVREKQLKIIALRNDPVGEVSFLLPWLVIYCEPPWG